MLSTFYTHVNDKLFSIVSNIDNILAVGQSAIPTNTLQDFETKSGLCLIQIRQRTEVRERSFSDGHHLAM